MKSLGNLEGQADDSFTDNFCLVPSSLVRLCDASYLCYQCKIQSIISIVAIPEPLHLLLRYKHSARALLLVCHSVCGSRSRKYWQIQAPQDVKKMLSETKLQPQCCLLPYRSSAPAAQSASGGETRVGVTSQRVHARGLRIAAARQRSRRRSPQAEQDCLGGWNRSPFHR